LVDPNFLADPDDLKTSVEGVKISRDVMHQPAFSKYVKREHFPGTEVRSQADLENHARRYGRTSIIPSAPAAWARTNALLSIRSFVCAG
jgi:choline dehydrogenase-like flavoprotein